MARKLGDVLHLLLGEEPDEGAPGGGDSARPVVLDPGAPPGVGAAPGRRVVVCRVRALDVAERSMAWNLAKAGLHDDGVDWRTMSGAEAAAGDDAPDACVLFLSAEPASRRHCERLLGLLPAGTEAFLVALGNARPSGEDLTRLRPGLRGFTFPDETALYRSWVGRQPICSAAPESPQAVALFRIAAAISCAGRS